jgi:hypothetical protein
MLLLLNRVNSTWAAVLSVVAGVLFIAGGIAIHHYQWIAMGALSIAFSVYRGVQRRRAPQASA